MFQIYREDDFPEGMFRTEKGRKVFLINAFRDVYRERMGKELTEEVLRAECHRVENPDESTYEWLPCLAIYHESLPYVRLYYRGGSYELHMMVANLSKEDALRVVIFDELEHCAVNQEAGA